MQKSYANLFLTQIFHISFKKADFSHIYKRPILGRFWTKHENS